jgi:FtsP/CotA-like multicopper oxidase with cupredoxin domain
VIRGELDRIPEMAAATERFLVLQDWDLGQDGRVLGASMPERMMMGREGALITVTAEATPVLEVPAGGLLRLRWLNASSSRFYLLGTDGPPLHVAATDGGGLPALRSVDRLLLAPGERADVLVQGEMSIRNFDYNRGSMGMMGMMGGRGMGRMRGGGMAPPTSGGSREQVLLRIRSTDMGTKPVPLPKSLVRVDPLPAPSATRSFTLGMRMGMGMMRGGSEMFTINGKAFDHNRIDTAVRLGTVEDWEYVNETTMDHPMHLHVNPFQVIGADGQVERAWRDVIVVKAQSRARFRVAFRDFPGKTVQHCHILDHEDMGMMATVEMRG